MTTVKRPYIVLIDDNAPDADAPIDTLEFPLIDFLHDRYGIDRVKLFQEPKDGIEFIKANLSERIIVLLDIMFGGKAIGFEVFEQITAESVLVCIIVMTGNLEATDPLALKRLINGHAWYLVTRDDSASYILNVVKEAENHLSMRIDGALEEWVMRQDKATQEKPFIASKEGKSYSLLDILRAIRTEDDAIAKKIIKSITNTAIDILSRDKSRIGN